MYGEIGKHLSGHRITPVDIEARPKKGGIQGTTYKSHALKAARELHYGFDVMAQIENAKTDAEITRIMKTARKRSFKDE